MNTIDDTAQLLRRAVQRARACGVPAMPPGRHPRELGVLVAVDAAGPLSQRRLGDILGVNRSVMVKLADTLQADGLLERERDPADKRNYALVTTPAGKAAIAEMTRGAARGDADLVAPLTTPERRRLVELLGRIVPDIASLVPAQLSELSGFLIPRAHGRVRALGAAALADLGFTPQQFGILRALTATEPCSQRQLATHLGVSGPAIVTALADLENRGIISRRRNPQDRREHLLQVTPAGREKLTETRQEIDQAHERLTGLVGAAELTELNVLLAKITA